MSGQYCDLSTRDKSSVFATAGLQDRVRGRDDRRFGLFEGRETGDAVIPAAGRPAAGVRRQETIQ